MFISGGYGKLESGRGIGLRFPRYVPSSDKCILQTSILLELHFFLNVRLWYHRYLRDRDDKKPEQATSAEQIYDMFMSQAEFDTIGKAGDDNGDDDDDMLIWRKDTTMYTLSSSVLNRRGQAIS